jgi:hypothetical protein
LLCATPVFAQATRTWVSGVGDDANPCSRTAPCKTFAGAISKTAANGVISVLDPGGYGVVTITKGITIDGGGIEGSIIGTGTTGIIVNAGNSDHVILRNLTIYGTGTGVIGIRVMGLTGQTTVDHCLVTGFGTGLDHNAAGNVYVYDSAFTDNSSFGAVIRQGRGTFEGVLFDHNTFDALRVTAGAGATVRRGTASGHSNVAFSAVGAGATLVVDDSLLANNAYGVGAMSGGSMTVGNSTVSGSTTQGVYFDVGSTLLTFGNNRLTGNAANGSFSGSVAVQ